MSQHRGNLPRRHMARLQFSTHRREHVLSGPLLPKRIVEPIAEAIEQPQSVQSMKKAAILIGPGSRFSERPRQDCALSRPTGLPNRLEVGQGPFVARAHVISITLTGIFAVDCTCCKA